MSKITYTIQEFRRKMSNDDCEICDGSGENVYGEDCLCVRQKAYEQKVELESEPNYPD